jgi:hypothetical protein
VLNDFPVGTTASFDAGRIWTYSYLIQPGNPVLSYGLQLTGTGPTIAGGSASLFDSSSH